MLGCVDNLLRPVGGPTEKRLAFKKVGRKKKPVLMRKVLSACSQQFKKFGNPNNVETCKFGKAEFHTPISS